MAKKKASIKKGPVNPKNENIRDPIDGPKMKPIPETISIIAMI